MPAINNKLDKWYKNMFEEQPWQVQEKIGQPADAVEQERNRTEDMKEERPANAMQKYLGGIGGEGTTQTITIHALVWQQMETAIEIVTREQPKLQNLYSILCEQVWKYPQQAKNIEPRGYKQPLTRTQM